MTNLEKFKKVFGVYPDNSNLCRACINNPTFECGIRKQSNILNVSCAKWWAKEYEKVVKVK